MVNFKYPLLNVYDDFIKYFNKLTKSEVLLWIKLVMDVHYDAKFETYNNEIIKLIDQSIQRNEQVVDARTLAFKIHKDAKRLQNDQQFYLRALAHMVSTIHVKTHALKCCDYLVKMIQFRTKDKDAVVSERLRQMLLIKDF